MECGRVAYAKKPLFTLVSAVTDERSFRGRPTSPSLPSCNFHFCPNKSSLSAAGLLSSQQLTPDFSKLVGAISRHSRGGWVPRHLCFSNVIQRIHTKGGLPVIHQ